MQKWYISRLLNNKPKTLEYEKSMPLSCIPVEHNKIEATVVLFEIILQLYKWPFANDIYISLRLFDNQVIGCLFSTDNAQPLGESILLRILQTVVATIEKAQELGYIRYAEEAAAELISPENQYRKLYFDVNAVIDYFLYAPKIQEFIRLIHESIMGAISPEMIN